jgi:arabinofuranosyltransferase
VSRRAERFDCLGWGLAFAAGFGLVVWGAIWVGDFIEDDTLISLRYAERLLDGKGLTWNDGERVEGYSNLAWVLACAVLGALGADLILAARILAFSCWVATFGALFMFARCVRATWQGFGAASIAFGATASLSVWAMGALVSRRCAVGVGRARLGA